MNFVQFSFVFCVSVVLFMVVMETHSQAMWNPNSENPDHPGLCYYDDYYGDGKNKFYLKPGQKRRHPKLCFEVKCDEDLGISTVGCGIAADMGHCRFIQGDKSKPYPRCCGEYVC